MESVLSVFNIVGIIIVTMVGTVSSKDNLVDIEWQKYVMDEMNSYINLWSMVDFSGLSFNLFWPLRLGPDLTRIGLALVGVFSAIFLGLLFLRFRNKLRNSSPKFANMKPNKPYTASTTPAKPLEEPDEAMLSLDEREVSAPSAGAEPIEEEQSSGKKKKETKDEKSEVNDAKKEDEEPKETEKSTDKGPTEDEGAPEGENEASEAGEKKKKKKKNKDKDKEGESAPEKSGNEENTGQEESDKDPEATEKGEKKKKKKKNKDKDKDKAEEEGAPEKSGGDEEKTEDGGEDGEKDEKKKKKKKKKDKK